MEPKTSVSFTLNGASVDVQDVLPSLTLNAWLRAQPGLTGTKKMCGEGGCGCCVVAVSLQSPVTQQETTFAINSVSRIHTNCGLHQWRLPVHVYTVPIANVSRANKNAIFLQCLCPLLSVEGWKITTVEGIGRYYTIFVCMQLLNIHMYRH